MAIRKNRKAAATAREKLPAMVRGTQAQENAATSPDSPGIGIHGMAVMVASGKGTRRARQAQRVVVEAAGKVWSGEARIRRRSATPAEVPPFCFQRPGLAPEEAAIAAAKALGMSHPVDALHTLWKLRAIAQAEHSSAQDAAQAIVTPSGQGDVSPAAHNATHKPLTKGAARMDEQVVITQGHRGKTEPAREEERKGPLGLFRQTVAVSGQPNQLPKGNKA
jgi:hypothetical protein